MAVTNSLVKGGNNQVSKPQTFSAFLTSDAIKNRTYYNYGDNKNEQAAKAYWDKIKK